MLRSLRYLVLVVLGLVSSALAQSSDLAFPTAVTESQLFGQIKARDIGDSRLTTYYYTFNGTQGDIFVNVVTKNLSGTVDVFAAEGMRPLTKITVYADLTSSETGRVIYLRKPEKLVLRVEGRTPNDDPAEFQVKFAGGFEAAIPRTDEPPVPKVGDLPPNESGVRVNSVGTIVAIVPKTTPTPKPETADIRKTETAVADKNDEEPLTTEAKKEPNEIKAETENTEKVTTPAAASPKRPFSRSNRRSANNARATKANPKTETPSNERTDDTSAKNDDSAVTPRKPPRVVVTDSTKALTPKSNPLENVRLVIVFKDGTKVERPMTEVLRFTADQSTLTIVNKNGRIARFSILEVASVSIQ